MDQQLIQEMHLEKNGLRGKVGSVETNKSPKKNNNKDEFLCCVFCMWERHENELNLQDQK